jgi:hypothetical protein
MLYLLSCPIHGSRLLQVNSDQATRLVSRGTELQHSVAHAVELKANLAGLQSDVTAAAVRELELVTKVSTLEQVGFNRRHCFCCE